MIIYLITNILDGTRYVGQTTKKLNTRWSGHKRGNDKTLISKAIRKYGHENFMVMRIDQATSLEELNTKEILWIDYLNTLYPYGYNLMIGGKNSVASEELKQRLSNKHKGKILSEQHKCNISKSRKGIKHSEETKIKMSKSHKGKTSWNKGLSLSEEHKTKIAKSNKLASTKKKLQGS